MIEIRAHGRGGQGAVTAMEILAKAAAMDGKFVQAFPYFGVERRGAPVRAFCRISEGPMTLRSQIYKPDYILVLDPSLLELPEIQDGLKEDSVVVANSREKPNPGFSQKTYHYDATSLAVDVLGRDIVNTAMLGVFAKATGLVSLESLLKVVGGKFEGKVAELNRQLVERAYKETGVQTDER